jgi:hypothetical protein
MQVISQEFIKLFHLAVLRAQSAHLYTVVEERVKAFCIYSGDDGNRVRKVPSDCVVRWNLSLLRIANGSIQPSAIRTTTLHLLTSQAKSSSLKFHTKTALSQMAAITTTREQSWLSLKVKLIRVTVRLHTPSAVCGS